MADGGETTEPRGPHRLDRRALRRPAPSEEIASLQQQAIADAVDAGQLGRAALKDAGVMVSILIKGVLTQAMANEPHLEWGEGRFTPTFQRLMKLLPAAYPPPATRSRRSRPPDGE